MRLTASVPALRYVQLVFWIGLLCFWIQHAFFNWRRYRDRDKVV